MGCARARKTLFPEAKLYSRTYNGFETLLDSSRRGHSKTRRTWHYLKIAMLAYLRSYLNNSTEIRWQSTGVLANCHRRLCSHEFLVSRATLLCGGEAKVAEAEQQGSKRAFSAHIHDTEYFSSAPADERSARRNHGHQHNGSGDFPSPPSTQGVTKRFAWDMPPLCSAGGGPLSIKADFGRSYRLPGAGRTES